VVVMNLKDSMAAPKVSPAVIYQLVFSSRRCIMVLSMKWTKLRFRNWYLVLVVNNGNGIKVGTRNYLLQWHHSPVHDDDRLSDARAFYTGLTFSLPCFVL
jgi:hypothetical protein